MGSFFFSFFSASGFAAGSETSSVIVPSEVWSFSAVCCASSDSRSDWRRDSSFSSITTSLSAEALPIISRTRATLACCEETRLPMSATFSVTSCASTLRCRSFPLPSMAPRTASYRSPGTRSVSVEVIRPSSPRLVDSLPT